MSQFYVLHKNWTKPNTSFHFPRGVRQRCILSPLLCNLYINNLPFAFGNTLSDPFVLSNGAKLTSLLYADDLIILSRSKTGLQNCLNTLSSFCTLWMLKINPKKPKITVFQKRARKCAKFHFFIGNRIIDVRKYTYLGPCMFSSGNFSVSCEHLKGKGLHAFFSLRWHRNLSELNPAIACKIFDTMRSSLSSHIVVKLGVCILFNLFFFIDNKLTTLIHSRK